MEKEARGKGYPVDRLREAGIQVDQLSEAQRNFLNELGPDEVNALVRIQERIATDPNLRRAAAGDTVGNIIF